jgi:myo-inositol-1(or 4)-monophosphatase
MIVETLRGARPGDGVVGEEHGALPGRSGLTWAIDPLDGTSNFVSGIPHWATAIGCADGGGPLLAVVFDPTRDELFAAARGEGATLDGRRVAGSSLGELRTAVAALGGAADRLAAEIAHGRQMGSLALDLAWTAAGRFDLFYYECGLEAWDVSLRVLADEAGLVTALQPSPPALLATPAALHDDVVRILSGTARAGRTSRPAAPRA